MVHHRDAGMDAALPQALHMASGAARVRRSRFQDARLFIIWVVMVKLTMACTRLMLSQPVNVAQHHV
jgi:hypothetical protein